MIITFDSGPLKGKVLEVADDTLEYTVEILPPAASPNKRVPDPTTPVSKARLRYRRSDRKVNGAVVFYADAS